MEHKAIYLVHTNATPPYGPLHPPPPTTSISYVEFVILF